MHPKLVEYCKRFQKNETKPVDYFYTQLRLDEYLYKLPYLFDIQNFCIRLLKALEKNEKICIYSDYDTDAVTATATMHWGLIELGFLEQNLSFYAPDRFTEGYGMNVEAVQDLAGKNDLIISVDCGINSVHEAEAVKNTNCDLIITDHHHLHADIPDCIAVVNPRLAELYTQKTQYPQLHAKCLKFLQTNPKSEKIKGWSSKLDRLMQKEKQNQFLSSSATGVGVAWFCLVWLGYFLEELEGLETVG